MGGCEVPRIQAPALSKAPCAILRPGDVSHGTLGTADAHWSDAGLAELQGGTPGSWEGQGQPLFGSLTPRTPGTSPPDGGRRGGPHAARELGFLSPFSFSFSSFALTARWALSLRVAVLTLFPNLCLLDLISSLKLFQYYSCVSCKAPQTLFGKRQGPNK